MASGGKTDGAPHTLPGSRPAELAGLYNYLVLLREAEEEVGGAPPGRRELYEAGLERAKAFERQLRKGLAERGLEDQVGAIVAYSFDLLALTCTPAVAKFAATFPEVESVTLDSDDVKLIR